jgi:hypothetical protein
MSAAGQNELRAQLYALYADTDLLRFGRRGIELTKRGVVFYEPGRATDEGIQRYTAIEGDTAHKIEFPIWPDAKVARLYNKSVAGKSDDDIDKELENEEGWQYDVLIPLKQVVVKGDC